MTVLSVVTSYLYLIYLKIFKNVSSFRKGEGKGRLKKKRIYSKVYHYTMILNSEKFKIYFNNHLLNFRCLEI